MNTARSVFYATLVFLAGATAAVFAHVAIDVSGDVLLAHDTYDGLEHHSRAIFIGIAAVLAAALVLRFLLETLGRQPAGLLPKRCGFGFVALVIVTSVGLLAGMEAYDAFASGVRVDGLEDLFGGSFVLGASWTVTLALFIALLVRALLAALTQWQPAIAAFFVRLLVSRECGRGSERVARANGPLVKDYACRFARSSGNRAPPLSTPVLV